MYYDSDSKNEKNDENGNNNAEIHRGETMVRQTVLWNFTLHIFFINSNYNTCVGSSLSVTRRPTASL